MPDQHTTIRAEVSVRPAVSRRSVLLASAGGIAAMAGLSALPAAANTADLATRGRLREYWLQADSWWHNTVPNGRDAMMGTILTPQETSFWALGYRAYTPGWVKPLQGNAQIGPNSGIPGPTIRARVGDTVRIHFRNNDAHYRFPHSVHVHGLRYRPDSDGSFVAAQPNKPGTAVPFGRSYTYEYTVPASSVGTWPYHDHSMAQSLKPGGDPIAEVGAELGLLGVIAVTDAHTPHADVENVLAFHDLYADDIPTIARDLDLFNGYAFLDNTPTFTAKVGQRVRWRIIALGKEFHVFHLHGHRWSDGIRQVDAQILGPSTTLTVEYTEEDPGDWLYHCHVTDHMMGGMVGRYHVT
jgi:manganese oxidase